MSQHQLSTKVNPEFFSTMEQKFVQRCETEIIADACNASYQDTKIFGTKVWGGSLDFNLDTYRYIVCIDKYVKSAELFCIFFLTH